MRKTLIRATLLIGFTGAIGVGIHAQVATGTSKTPVVLELFTSEGCSSCPPADRLLQSLDKKQPFSGVELVVLSEHVDYWNGDGWADPYSSKLFSTRQQSYAEHFGLDSVYTPQVVVDGQREMVGGNAVAIRNAVKAAASEQKVPLTLTNAVRDGNGNERHIAITVPLTIPNMDNRSCAVNLFDFEVAHFARRAPVEYSVINIAGRIDERPRTFEALPDRRPAARRLRDDAFQRQRTPRLSGDLRWGMALNAGLALSHLALYTRPNE